MSINEIKEHFDIGEDIPLDMVKFCSNLNVSALPKNLAELEPERCILCAFMTKEGRSALFYDESLINREFSEFPVSVQALVHYMLTNEKSFVITPHTKVSDREQKLVFELLMPENQVEEILDKLVLPTTYSLSKIFRVPQEFVRNRLDAMGTKKQIAGYNY
jgi:hypothetical protein